MQKIFATLLILFSFLVPSRQFNLPFEKVAAQAPAPNFAPALAVAYATPASVSIGVPTRMDFSCSVSTPGVAVQSAVGLEALVSCNTIGLVRVSPPTVALVVVPVHTMEFTVAPPVVEPATLYALHVRQSINIPIAASIQSGFVYEQGGVGAQFQLLSLIPGKPRVGILPGKTLAQLGSRLC